MGRIIGWGEGQGPEAIEQTQNVTKSLNRTQVLRWRTQGLTKSWVEKQLSSYTNAMTNATKLSKNAQLVHRKELMEQILKLW